MLMIFHVLYSEIDYVKVLNKVLPKDIRVLGWCPVSTDFHARFLQSFVIYFLCFCILLGK